MGQQCRSESRTRRSRTAAAPPDPSPRPRGAGASAAGPGCSSPATASSSPSGSCSRSSRWPGRTRSRRSTTPKSILLNAAPGMIVALGLTVVLAMGDFDLSIGSMVGLAAGAAVALMVDHGCDWRARDRPRARDRRSVGRRQRVAGRRPRRQLVHHDARDGDDPDRGRVRLHEPGRRLPGRPAGVRRDRRGRVARDSQPGLDRARSSRSSCGSCSTRPSSGASCTRSAATRRRRASPGIRTRTLRIVGFVIVALTAAIVGILISSAGGGYTPNAGPVPAPARLRRRVPRRGVLPARRVQHPGHGRRRALPRRRSERG